MKKRFTVEPSPKSDNPVICSRGTCFKSMDGMHFFRQEKDYVLHMKQENEHGHFIINTLHDNHLSQMILDEEIFEIHADAFRIQLEHYKLLVSMLA